MDFSRTYMPLVMGGIIVYDNVLTEGERLGELLQELRTILDKRSAARDESTEAIFHMAEQLIDQALMKYGYRNK
jgi:predicted O-methyltransferase YrrM